MRTLIAGWFSYDQMGATAGDLLALGLVREWLKAAQHDYDIALAAQFPGGVDWRLVDPTRYSHVVFVCGPFLNRRIEREFLDRFKMCRLVGLNLSMLEPLELWNPFDLLWERDSSVSCRPDITYLSTQHLVPVVGCLLVHPQPEYGQRAMHETINEAVGRLLASSELAVVPIDTRLDTNRSDLRNPAEIESLIARMDAVVTTRLHGMVLALKNGVPALAIDPISGGAKLKRQADAAGWRVAFAPEDVSDKILTDALDYCLTEQAKTAARQCAARARETIRHVQDEFIAAFR
jgi:hypothetical protein